MTDTRGSVSQRVRQALFALSRGRCYAPDCTEPIVVIVHDEVVFVGQVAHIVAATANGPRGSAAVTDREAFSNLMVLCGRHHTIIDSPQLAGQYPPDLLRRWKRQRENDFDATTLAALDALGPITGRLPALLVQSFREVNAELKATIDRFEAAGTIAHGAAQMLRQAVDELPGAGSSLYESASMLLSFADQMPDLDRTAWNLISFAEDGHGFALRETVTELKEAVAEAASTNVDVLTLQRTVAELRDVVAQLPEPGEYTTAAAHLTTAGASIRAPRPLAYAAEPVYRTGTISIVKAIAIALAVGVLIGAVGIGWFLHDRSAAAARQKDLCTGSSAPANFTVTVSTTVHGTPSASPFSCPSWYPAPIARPRHR